MAFEIHRGPNVGGWLSQSKRRGQERVEFFTRDDVQRIAGWGFDHIRLPVDEEQLWTEDGAKDAEAFDLLDAALDWCEQADLRVIVDLHLLRSHHFLTGRESPLWTTPAEAEHFGDLWRQLSEHLEPRSEDRVAYELLNEAVASDPADWNRVLRVGLLSIRKREPTRKVVVGSNSFNQPKTYDELDVPDDKNLILTFHFYYPMLITHYNASWTPCKVFEGPVQYPGPWQADPADIEALPDSPQKAQLKDWNEPFNAEKIAETIAQPLAKRAQTGLPLYCGEFGCISKAPLEAREKWFQDVLGVFESNGIGWAVWSYKGVGFGLVDADGNPTDIAATVIPQA